MIVVHLVAISELLRSALDGAHCVVASFEQLPFFAQHVSKLVRLLLVNGLRGVVTHRTLIRQQRDRRLCCLVSQEALHGSFG